MNSIKRVVSVALIVFLCMGLTSTESRADSKLDRIASSLEPIEIRITDPDEIRAYLEEQGEAYDENLVEVVRHIYPTLDNDIVAIDREISDTEDVVDYSEFFSKNLTTKKITDFNSLLKYYNRPAGKVAVKESISVSNKITVSAGIKIKYVEAALGITYEETSTIAVDWENKFDFPVRIEIYPTYEIKNGELWEEDVFFDDYYGTFEYWRAVGDDLRLYKNN